MSWLWEWPKVRAAITSPLIIEALVEEPFDSAHD